MIGTSIRVILKPQFITQASRICSRWVSSNHPRELENELPGPEFLNKFVRKPSQKEKFTSIISELQTFFQILGSGSLPKLTNDVWANLMLLYNSEERAQFLIHLRRMHLDEVRKSESKNTLDRDTDEQDNINSLYHIAGSEFRRTIDKMFFSRVLRMEKMEESLPQLIVDCRFLKEFNVNTQSTFIHQIQQLHDSNWTSRLPFKITIANFAPDQQLSEVSKRLLHFRYGPSYHNGPFSPHIFAPTITSRDIKSVLPCKQEETIYISWRAKEILPDIPPPAKAVIMCASSDLYTNTSSSSAAIQDKFKTYRIPVEKYVLLKGNRRVLPFAQTSTVLRSYFRGDDIGEAIRRSFSEVKLSRRARAKEDEQLIENFKTAIVELNRERVREAKQKEFLDSPPSNKDAYKKTPARRVYTHKYSRKERNELKMKEQIARPEN